jgi:hypothetical protein
MTDQTLQYVPPIFHCVIYFDPGTEEFELGGVFTKAEDADACEEAFKASELNISVSRDQMTLAGIKDLVTGNARARTTGGASAVPYSLKSFIADWSSGALSLPFMACTKEQAYRAYRARMAAIYDQYPVSAIQFSQYLHREAARGLQFEEKLCRLPKDGTVGQLARCLIFCDIPEEHGLTQWVSRQVQAFEEALRKFQGAAAFASKPRNVG